MEASITLRVDGEERLGVASMMKGCDHGQGGACTVPLDGRLAITCLALAVAHDGAAITTSRGLAESGRLHPSQQAFLDHDALQCGCCTPGQICSAVGVLQEARVGHPSFVGAAAAIANAVHHAAGKRVRDLPITPDNLFTGSNMDQYSIYSR